LNRSLPQFGRKTPLRYRCQFLLSLGDRLGDIKPSVTGPMFHHIGIPVIARTDDIEILFLGTCR
jgi:hypothetical protein